MFYDNLKYYMLIIYFLKNTYIFTILNIKIYVVIEKLLLETDVIYAIEKINTFYFKMLVKIPGFTTKNALRAGAHKKRG